MLKNIVVKNASENNLKNLSVTIPRNKLVVFTGVSGSGKSSLAFGTIFAEGQRRFMESLSSYARQFLGQSKKPNVEYIEGLSPSISIDQKTTNHNPRSTVGTVTEIYDYLRLLYARVGSAFCPKCNKQITRQSVDQIAEQILAKYNEQLLTIEAPVVRGQKGSFQKELEQWRKSGIVRVKVDGSIYSLDEQINLDKNIRHDINVIVDRIKITADEQTRINEAIESAIRLSDGLVIVTCPETNAAETFSNKYACIECGISIVELEPRSFSFNSPHGACPNCTGLGFTLEIDENLLIPNPDLTIAEGAILASGWNADGKIGGLTYSAFCKTFNISIHTKIKDIPKEVLHKLLHGCEEKLQYEYQSTYSTDNHFGVSFGGRFEGIASNLKRRYRETHSEFIKQEIGKLMVNSNCPVCLGRRLKPEALCVTVGKLNISELTALPIRKTLEYFDALKLSGDNKKISEPIIKEIKARCNFLVDVGLHYLTLARNADSLSGGEAQRIRLATQIGSGLVGVLYILDEPSIGLHQRDNQKLLSTLMRLRDLGNTLIVVEHDDETIRSADFIVDIGPHAGAHGGELVVAGTLDEVKACEKSITGRYLAGKFEPDVSKLRKPSKDAIVISGATQNNLKNLTVKFPLGVLTCVTGVSGSGKSTLVNKILYPSLYNKINRSTKPVGKHESVTGYEKVDKVISIDQSPIGRTPRSNPATYTGVFTTIRELFANTPDAKERGYEIGRFSFNVRGGRCDHCEGDGIRKIQMHFLPDIYVTCEVCNGKRFNKETLEVRFKQKNIFDILDMTVDEAVEFFEKIPKIHKIMKTIQDVGLGYIKLGQTATSLSGGEAQRVKLATELARASTGQTLYVLDEPTTGLHPYDTQKLITILHRLVDAGNTVLVIEHNLDVIKVADHIIDLGPEGGDEGGTIVATGTPAEIAKNANSATGQFLR